MSAEKKNPWPAGRVDASHSSAVGACCHPLGRFRPEGTRQEAAEGSMGRQIGLTVNRIGLIVSIRLNPKKDKKIKYFSVIENILFNQVP